LSSVCQHFVSLRYGLLRVVGPFCMDRRSEHFEHIRYIRLIEQNNMIDTPQCRNEYYSFCLGEDRTPRVLNLTHRFIAVHSNDEYVSQLPSIFKISQMTDMQNIEAAIGQNHFLPGHQRRQILKLPQFHWALSCTAFISSSKVTGRVPYFMTTIPPA